MPSLLVDTDILIDIGNNDATAKRSLADKSFVFQVSVSSITVMELLVGCRNKREQQNLAKFLRQFVIIPINESASQQAIQLIETYTLSHALKIPDALIAATAIVYNIPLITKNQKDYRYIANLQLLTYP